MNPRDDPAARQRLLFEEMVDLEPDERAARLRRLDPNDPDVARVVRLLEAHDRTADALEALEFLRAPDASGRVDSSFDAVAAFAPSYAIEGELHGGGMSRVFFGRDAKLGRKIVAKVLPPDLGAEVNLGRFQQEIRLAAQLRHPHIVPLLQSGEAAGCLYYTMPLIEGESLRDRLRRDGTLPVPVALRFATEIADALGYAHGLGIIHRDIKPGNVLIDSGHAIVTDFGIARALSDAATETITRSGTVIGTPDEQAARAFPSSPMLQQRLAELRVQSGDSAGAVDAVTRGVALAPRSVEQAFYAMYTMLQLRHYDDARVLLARARALEPEGHGVQVMAADLATAVGDTAGVSAAMRALRAAGEGFWMLDQMRSGDAALQQELAAVSLTSMHARTADDTATYYRAKAQLFLSHGEAARARALVDSAYRLAASQETKVPAGPPGAATWWRVTAWNAAARGDRAAAVAALRQSAADPLIRYRPGGASDADQTCTSAEVYGLLGDAEAMLPLLRRCLTMANGYPLAQLGQPAFARLRADPRVRALTAELVAAQARAPSMPVRAGR